MTVLFFFVFYSPHVILYYSGAKRDSQTFTWCPSVTFQDSSGSTTTQFEYTILGKLVPQNHCGGFYLCAGSRCVDYKILSNT